MWNHFHVHCTFDNSKNFVSQRDWLVNSEKEDTRAWPVGKPCGRNAATLSQNNTEFLQKDFLFKDPKHFEKKKKKQFQDYSAEKKFFLQNFYQKIAFLAQAWKFSTFSWSSAFLKTSQVVFEITVNALKKNRIWNYGGGGCNTEQFFFFI